MVPYAERGFVHDLLAAPFDSYQCWNATIALQLKYCIEVFSRGDYSNSSATLRSYFLGE